MYLDWFHPAFFGSIPKGVAGTKATLNLMRDIVRMYRKHPLIRQTAAELVSDLPQKSWIGEIDRLHRFVRDHIRYLKDTRGVETVQTPTVTLDLGQGDCDDKSVLLASLLESIGHPTRFVAIGYQPGRYEHVYVETKLNNSWISLDPTEPVPVGWTPRTPRMITRVNV